MSEEYSENPTYTVQDGDTLPKIAVRHGITTFDLCRINKLTTATYIFPGQQLTIPKSTPTNQSPKTQETKPNYSDILNLSFETSKLPKNDSANSESEESGFFKANAKLLPDCIDGTLIVTPQALMFDPIDKEDVNFGIINPLNEISWCECVRVPKETATTKKLSTEMPMLNSLMRSFSDYFEESSDTAFDFIFMKFGKDEQFNYFKCNQEDVNRLFNILDENPKLKYVLGSPIFRDSSYSDFYSQVKDLYPGIQPNWFLYNEQLHKKVQASYEGLLSSYVKPSSDTLTDFNPSIEEPSFYLPELVNYGKTNRILGDTEESAAKLTQISKWLPESACAVSQWRKIFFSETQGHSLANLYRTCEKEKLNSFNVILIESAKGSIFGAFLTEMPHIVEPGLVHRHYGSGESFIFTFESKAEKWCWSGENNFIATGDKDYFAVGGGSGVHGLWIDSRLKDGSSQECDTFRNDRSLGGDRDFVISTLEVWVLE